MRHVLSSRPSSSCEGCGAQEYPSGGHVHLLKLAGPEGKAAPVSSLKVSTRADTVSMCCLGKHMKR